MQTNSLNHKRQHIKQHASQYIILWLLSCALAMPAKGDTLLLRNGDRISGEILSFDHQTFQIQTEYAGTIKVDIGAVHSFSTDRPKQWQLDLKTHTTQIHAADKSGYVLIDNHPIAFSQLTLSQSQSKWQRTGNLETSLEIDKDEKRKQKLHINGELNLESKHWRHNIKSEIKQDKEDERKTEDNAEVGYTLDYFVNTQWLVRSDNFYRENKLQDNGKYLQTGLGPGYRFWGEGLDRLDVTLTYNHFWLTTNQLDIAFNAWAVTLNYKHFWLDSKLETFADWQIAYPDFAFIEHIANTNLGARYRLTRHIHLSLKYDYNETKTTLSSNNDSSYTLGAGLSF